MFLAFSKHTLSTCFLFLLSLHCFSQKSSIVAKTITIGSDNIAGYETGFNQSEKEVKRAWWSYAKDFGTLENLKTHYIVTIPSEISGASFDVKLLAKTLAMKSSTNFFLGAKDQKLKPKIEPLVADFKRTFYTNRYLEEIRVLKRKASRLTRKYDRSKKQRFFSELQKLENQIALKLDQIKALN